MSNSDNNIYMKRSEIDDRNFDLFNKTKKYESDGVEVVQIGTEIVIPGILGLLLGYFISAEIEKCNVSDKFSTFLQKWAIYIFPIIGVVFGILLAYDEYINKYFKKIDILSKLTIRGWSKFLFYKIFIFAIIFYMTFELNIIKLIVKSLASPIKIVIFVYLLWLVMLFINLIINYWNEDENDNVFINYSDVFNTFFKLVLSISVLFGLLFYIQGLQRSTTNLFDTNAYIISKQKLWFELPFVLGIIIIIAVVLKSYTYNKFTLDLRNIINREQFIEKCPSSLNILQNNQKSIPTSFVNQLYIKNNKKFSCKKNTDNACTLYIRDFYWPCSYNTFSIDGTNYGGTDIYAIERAIQMGAKVLHLAIYSNGDNLVIGMKNNINNTDLDINTTFNKIFDMVWKNNPQNPLVLYLELGSNNNYDISAPDLDNLATSINKYFGNNNKLINSKYGFNGNGIGDKQHKSPNNNFGNIPIIDIIGKVAILTNKYPTSSEDLNKVINGCITCKNNEYITSLVLKRNEDISTITFHGKEKSIDYNKLYITAIFPAEINSTANILHSGISLYNLDFQPNWDHGCQFVFMNYQLCDVKDIDNRLKNYINKFKNDTIILKPDNMRYIQSPPVKHPTQSLSASWKPHNMNTITGLHPAVTL